MTDDNPAGADPGLQDLPADRRANLDAVLYPPASGDDSAGVEVAGACGEVWGNGDHELCIKPVLRDAAAWLRRPDGTVAVRLEGEAGVLFTADVMPAPASEEDAGQP